MQQNRRSLSSIIARAGLATAAMAAGGVAMATDISWSVGIASPRYQVVVAQAPPVVVYQPVVVVQQPRVPVHRPVVAHVAQPQVIYTGVPVFADGHGHRAMVARDLGRHGYGYKNKHKPRYYRYDRHGYPPGYDGNWGNN